MNLLFVCTAGEQLSPTAAGVYQDRGYPTRFAGIHGIGSKTLEEEDLEWADRVFVMENMHREFIEQQFTEHSKQHEITVLNIPDIYLQNDPDLISLIERKMPEL